jgi:hypothetical protein
MRAVYTVSVRRYAAGAKDAHGNPVASHGSPEPLQVYGVAPKGSQEPGADRLAVSTGLMLLMPPEAVLGPHDLVIVDGDEWEIEGEVADYTRGPFGFRPGKTVALKRTEG